jgi:hypothetical protein
MINARTFIFKILCEQCVPFSLFSCTSNNMQNLPSIKAFDVGQLLLVRRRFQPNIIKRLAKHLQKSNLTTQRWWIIEAKLPKASA